MEPSERPDLRVPFGADVEAPAHVRTTVADRLVVRDATARDVMLAASELVTNVIVHTSGGGELLMWVDDERVRLEVHDLDPHPPRVGGSTTGPEGGFGLRIVESTSRDWGWTTTAQGGKSVWAEFVVDRAADRSQLGADRGRDGRATR